MNPQRLRDIFTACLQVGHTMPAIWQILHLLHSLQALAIMPQHMLLRLATHLQVGAIVGMDSGSDEGEVEEQGAFKCRFSGHCHLTTHREASSTRWTLPQAAVCPCIQPAGGTSASQLKTDLTSMHCTKPIVVSWPATLVAVLGANDSLCAWASRHQ